MLRRIPGAELDAASAPSVHALLAPERSALTEHVRTAYERSAAIDALRAELRARLTAVLSAKLPELLGQATSIGALVDAELERMRRAETIEVHVHPEDAAALESETALTARLGLSGVLTYVADENISRGGCVVHTNRGHVDARIETRLERLCAAIVEAICR
jgi:flagellar biosynthesis/type III secretory pathway protein FliH